LSIYEKIGIRKVINARGIGLTGIGGSVMSSKVVAAMDEASKSYVYISELRRKVGEVIARVTGADDGCVTCGAAAGIAIMTAACMCGADLIKLGRLPHTEGLRNEMIIPWGHAIHYIAGSGNCIEITGAKPIYIGCVTGARVSMGDYKKELEGAINEKTAAVFYCLSDMCIQKFWQITLEEVVEVAHEREVPVIVDAAAYPDLKYPTSAGADLATFSGGKYVGGPSASGFICGRKDLIEACELAQWTIGRTMKVGKEEIVGLMVALEEYEKRDWSKWASPTATIEQATRWAQYICDSLREPPIPHVEVTLMPSSLTVSMRVQSFMKKYPLPPEVQLKIDEEGLGMTAHEVYEALAEGKPSVLVGDYNAKLGILEIRTSTLMEGEEKVVSKKVRKVLTERKKGKEAVPYPH
jgi:L-seryl-tRNA(Ser) seleniumtransferase/D-glucosaminate-6-phosphate ammonia-lyase